MKIRLNSLPPGQPVPFDLFVQIGTHFVHYLRAGDTIEVKKVTAFEKKAPEAFYIFQAERANYQKFIRNYLNSTIPDNKQKAMILRESTMVLIEEMFENPNIERVLHDARQVVDDFVQFMDDDTSALADLIGLSSHDFYTYNHSLDVSIYSLGLGQALGYGGKDLKELGLGGLFHDIGKRFISLDIICKSGALTDEEWTLMQKHPQFGLSILTEHKASPNVKACAFEHHESFGMGNGYPQKISGDLIHPMARVVAVVDTYDALTTKRSYHDPMRPVEAIDLMNSKLSPRFDPDVMKAMNSIFDRMRKVA